MEKMHSKQSIKKSQMKNSDRKAPNADITNQVLKLKEEIGDTKGKISYFFI
jgi:hypothetical protein